MKHSQAAFFARFGLITATVALTWVSSQTSPGVVSYTTPDALYTQNFDSLPNTPLNVSLGASPTGWIDDTASPAVGNFSILGWYLYHPTVQAEGGFNGHQRVRIGAGTASTGSFMSFGPASGATTDRALGDIGSNTLTPTPPTPPLDIYIGLRLRNDTGVALGSFTLSYFGEQWRDGGAAAPVAQAMTFGWSTTATAINDPNSAFTSVTALDFTSPVFVNTGSGAAVDGNAAGRVAIGAIQVFGIDWQPGADLWLRWDDINHSGNDHGLAIDDLSFFATVPEPSVAMIAGIASCAFLVFRRRK